ncbi:uncharacterized protein Z520_00409 [Fonsecaea multimorphosa CBS 102226]|uniref:Methyltransferase domain-containing protein n=1 Tax=Fonsecaea multimorphosa CBS 102226 TaxID=1442371 RepID=A0A0D2KC43_9EURO|nr:uncharacterized protein Z520_00409 [Fonsecaea multimorphosa CBS 102226]KIY03718.1 hypothetical protein Z520_00409 [Fonsecaea multimorphosa CBS 102226]OAL32416.1 hypothetical protein AYO22_00438 [Fonsecaea multimorphosa]
MSDNPPASSGVTGSGSRAYPYEIYKPELEQVPAGIATLLAEYAGIPPEEQKEHIKTVRDRAFKSHPYPCLGRWRFLELDLSSHPLYQSYIVPMLSNKEKKAVADDDDGGDGKNDWIFLDLGCCLGQDIRKLIFDGGDASRIYGGDLRPEFIEVGYELFRDEDKFPRAEHFIAPADVFDFSSESELSKKCDGRVAILHSTAVFHLFDWDQQVTMARRCLQLLTTKKGRVLICGCQVGNENPGEFPRRLGGGSRYRHNEASWKKMWDQVVQQESDKYNIRNVEVGAVMLGRNNSSRIREELEAHARREAQEQEGRDQDQETSDNKAEDGVRDSNNQLKHIGRLEEGFRWMKYWVWIDFA